MVNHPRTMSKAENKKQSLLTQQAPWKIALKNTLLLGQQRRKKFLPFPRVQITLLRLLVTWVHSCTVFLCLAFVLRYTLIKYPFSYLSLVPLEHGTELLWLIPVLDYLSAVNRVCQDINNNKPTWLVSVEKLQNVWAIFCKQSFTHHHCTGQGLLFFFFLKIPVFKAEFEWQSWIRKASRFLPMGLFPLGNYESRQRFQFLQNWTLRTLYHFIETLLKLKKIFSNR